MVFLGKAHRIAVLRIVVRRVTVEECVFPVILADESTQSLFSMTTSASLREHSQTRWKKRRMSQDFPAKDFAPPLKLYRMSLK